MNSNVSLAPTTICSALVYNRDKIAVKDTGDGLSLLGGHVEWEYGMPECIQRRVYLENGIRFTPRSINGITHHKTPSQKEVINVNIVGEVTDTSEQRGIRWLGLEEALSLEDDYRTPDTQRLLLRTYRQDSVPLDFIQTTSRRKIQDREDIVPLASTEIASLHDPFRPTDFVVVSAAIRYQNRETKPEYCFMVCGRVQFAGTLSLFGGKLERGEDIRTALLRELKEESHGTISVTPLGMVGLYVNKVAAFAGQPADYAANFAVMARAGNKVITLPDEIKPEVHGLRWIDTETLGSMPEHDFRTPDTKKIALRAEHLIHQRKVLPFSFIEQIP